MEHGKVWRYFASYVVLGVCPRLGSQLNASAIPGVLSQASHLDCSHIPFTGTATAAEQEEALERRSALQVRCSSSSCSALTQHRVVVS